MSHQMHLNKSGSGFTSRTACGRNILRTPMSTDWENFKMEAKAYRCIKCETSKQFEVNARMDARKEIYNVPSTYNPEFLGAQPARAGQDY
jgi:hypothetical protein